MESSRKLGILLVLTLVLVALMLVMNSVLPKDEYRALAGAEFFVS